MAHESGSRSRDGQDGQDGQDSGRLRGKENSKIVIVIVTVIVMVIVRLILIVRRTDSSVLVASLS